MATSSTAAITQTRLDSIELQIKSALRNTVDISDDVFERVVVYGLETEAISRISIFALGEDDNGGEEIYGSLIIDIDWDKHSANLVRSGSMFTEPSSWRDGASPDIVKLSKYLANYVKTFTERDLTIDWQFGWRPGVDVQLHRAKMGTKEAPTRTWVKGRELTDLFDGPLNKLTEVNISGRFVER